MLPLAFSPPSGNGGTGSNFFGDGFFGDGFCGDGPLLIFALAHGVTGSSRSSFRLLFSSS